MFFLFLFFLKNLDVGIDREGGGGGGQISMCTSNNIPCPKHTTGHRNGYLTDKNRTKNKMVFLNWMNITMQHSKGIGVQVWPHLARDALLWQHLWLYL